jgi:predicted DCC family thiol-disulfide oxidoreductase YuxK
MATETLLRPENLNDPRAGARLGAESERTPSGSPLTVVFDGECGVCRETIQQLRRWDREDRIEFVPLSHVSASGRPLLERLAAEGRFDDAINVVDESTGGVVNGGHAVLAIIDALPGGWLLRPWAVMPQTAIAADVVCRLASRHRDALAWMVGMRDDVRCPVQPEGEPASTLEPVPASGPGRKQG